MEQELTTDDIDFLLESLRYTRERLGTYQHYPSPEFRKERMDYADAVRGKLRDLKKELVQLQM